MFYLNGAWIGGFLVDTLHQLVTDTALVPITRCWGWIPKINLEVDEIRRLRQIDIILVSNVLIHCSGITAEYHR